MAFCLTKEKAEKFKRAIKSGKLDVHKLSDPVLSSEARRNMIKDAVGLSDEVAREVNALFESKLLLKYQATGIKNWIKKTSGMTESAKRDFVSRVNRLEKALTPGEGKTFVKDFVYSRLGIDATEEEAKKVFELTKDLDKLEQGTMAKGLSKTGQQQADIAYGEALMDLEEYTDKLRPKGFKIGSLAFNIANLPQSVMTSLDMSAPRQLWGLMSTGAFWKNTPKMVSNWFSAKSARTTMAEIMGSKYYKISQAPSRNKLVITSELDKMARKEDDVMSEFADKLPILKQSSRSFRGMINATRLSRFKTMYDSAKKAGEVVDPRTPDGKQTIEDINRRINIFSARGSLGKGDKYQNASPILNMLFWSVRKISADINMLDPRLYLTGSKTARRASLRALIGSLAITAGMLATADLAGAEVEYDPRSSDFGKIKIGKHRIDVTGGKGALVRIITRLGAQAIGKKDIKATKTGKVFKGGDFYSPKALLSRFSKNKLAPMAGMVADLMAKPELLEGKDFLGRDLDLKKLTVENVGKELAGVARTKDQTTEWTAEKLRPMIISTIFDMAFSGERADVIALLTLFEIFGYGVQTYD